MSLSRSHFLPHRSLLAAGAASALVLMSGMVGVGLPQALAHDSVVGGNPAPNSVVEEFPEQIELEFSGIPQDSFNTVAVSDSGSGEVLFNGEPELEDRMVILPVPEDVDPGPGNYTVGFQITSSDGHATRGSITFEVSGDEAGTGEDAGSTTEDPAAETAEDTTSPEDQLLSGPLGWVFGGAGVLLALGVLVMMITKNRNRS